GAGGLLVELLPDSQSLLLLTNRAAIEAALLQLKNAVLLQGFRDKAAADMPSLVSAFEAVDEYACLTSKQLIELVVSRLLAGSQGTLAVDAILRLSHSQV